VVGVDVVPVGSGGGVQGLRFSFLFVVEQKSAETTVVDVVNGVQQQLFVEFKIHRKLHL
jgi:hypothetical protein